MRLLFALVLAPAAAGADADVLLCGAALAAGLGALSGWAGLLILVTGSRGWVHRSRCRAVVLALIVLLGRGMRVPIYFGPSSVMLGNA